MLSKKQSDFVEYLLEFYGPGGLWADAHGNPAFHRKPMQRQEAEHAALALSARSGFEGDSVDREKARDLVLKARRK